MSEEILLNIQTILVHIVEHSCVRLCSSLQSTGTIMTDSSLTKKNLKVRAAAACEKQMRFLGNM